MDRGPCQEQAPLHTPKGPKLRKELRHDRKALTDRYHQLLSGHAATDDYLCSKVHKLPSDNCWCGQDVRQTRHHLPARELRGLEAPDQGTVERHGLSPRMEASQGAQNGLALWG